MERSFFAAFSDIPSDFDISNKFFSYIKEESIRSPWMRLRDAINVFSNTRWKGHSLLELIFGGPFIRSMEFKSY